VGREFGGDLIRDLFDGIGFLGTFQAEEYGRYAIENRPTIVQCHDGVFESRWLRIVGDGIDFEKMLFHAVGKGRTIVIFRNSVEWRSAVWGVVLGVKNTPFFARCFIRFLGVVACK